MFLLLFALSSSPLFAGGLARLDALSLVPQDGTFAPAVMDLPAAQAPRAVRVLYSSQDAALDARAQRLLEIGRRVAPCIVKIIVVVPYGEYAGGPYTKVDSPDKPVVLSGGSGVLWSRDGRIVTNAHVFEDPVERYPSARIYVKFYDDPSMNEHLRTDVPVKILGQRFHHQDLAFLRLETDRTDLPTIPISDKPLRFMSEVLAFGYPLSAGLTPTGGFVASLNATANVQQTWPLVHLIQHSAPINPGDSGGALVDMDGRLVGINVAYGPLSATAINFAIPVQNVIDAEREMDLLAR